LINQTNIINKTRWINTTRWIDKKREVSQKSNESLTIIKKVSERSNKNKGNETKFNLDFNNIYVLGGVGVGGILILSCTFYIAWNCGLREKVENMITVFFIGEDGKSCLDNFFCLKEYFDYLNEIREEKKDQMEYYGLSPQEIAVCKEAKAINRIKYEAALKVKWDEITKHAVRPDDIYHRSLFKQVFKPKMIELSELDDDIPTKKDDPELKEEIETMEQGLPLYEIQPGTPRRRRNSVRI